MTCPTQALNPRNLDFIADGNSELKGDMMEANDDFSMMTEKKTGYDDASHQLLIKSRAR